MNGKKDARGAKGKKSGTASPRPDSSAKAPAAARRGAWSGPARRTADGLTLPAGSFSAIFGLIHDPTTITDIETGRIVDLNDAAARWFGRSRGEAIGRTTAEVHVWADLSDRDRMLREMKARGEIIDMPFRLRMHTGEVRDTLFSSKFVEIGEKRYLLSRAHDITEHNRDREALRCSEEKFRTAFYTSPDAVTISSLADGRYVSVNRGFTQISGYAESEVIGRTTLELNIWNDPKERQRLVEDLAARGEVLDREARFRTKQGSIRYCLVSASIMEIDGVPHVLSMTRDITDRRRAEQEIAENSAMLRQIMDTASVGIGSVSMAGRFTHANRSMAGMFGCTMAEFIGSEYVDHVHPAERETAGQSMKSLLASKVPSVDLDRLYQRKDGTVFWGHLTCNRFYDAQGKSLGLIGVISDITERKQAEERLRENERLLSTILDNVGAAIFIKDSRYCYTYVNRKACEVLGRSAQEIVGKEDDAFFPPESVEEIMQSDRPVIERGETVARAEYGLVTADGVPRTYWTVKLPLRDGSGAVTGLCGISTDITERRRTEEALQRNERMLETIIDAEPACVKLLDGNANLLLMNRAGLDMIEVESLDQVKGECVVSMVDPGHRDAFMDLTRRVFQGESGTLAFEMSGVKGRRLWLETHAVPLRNEKNEIIALLGVTRDITDQKKAEDRLSASEARFREIVERASIGVLVADAETKKFRFANPEICRLLGYAPDELLSLSVQDIHPAEELQVVAETFRRQLERTQLDVRTVCKRKDGSLFPVSIRSTPLEMDGLPCLMGFFTDISEQRLLEEERLKAQKLESIGTLAGGIAHDFNNLLQGIFGYISMAKLTIDRREQSLSMLEQAEKALHQSVSLTTQLLTFSKGGKPLKRLIDLRPVIESAVRFALSGSRADARLALSEDLRAVEADQGQVGQVVQNIVLNADQSMPEGGTVEIAARNLDRKASSSVRGLVPGEYVEVSVRDSGIGIPEQYLTKIFDPYFTTKEKGSGLGLATAYSIVRNHGGLITASSEPGKGTLFRVYLPASERSPQPATPRATAIPGRRGRVLVMDDEDVVRTVAGELVRMLGHDVQLAAHGEAAIRDYQEAREAGQPFDVVILDLTVRGGVGGLETLRRLREMDPDVKAVVTSGYSDDAIASDYRKHGFLAFLKKPYDLEKLRDVLSDVIV